MRKFCAYCGARINPEPVDGTPPEQAEDSWYEKYECSRGHTGRLRWNNGRTSYEGAINPAIGGETP